MRVLFLAGLLLACVNLASAQIRIVGSDLLGADFDASVQAFSRRNDLGVTLQCEGTRIGLEQLTQASADLGIFVFAPGEALPKEPYVAIPVAYHTSVVLVPNELPLSQITFAQLAGIYGQDGKNTIKRWNDLGVTGQWAARSILANIVGPNEGLAYDLFRTTVLSSPELKPTVTVYDTSPAAIAKISGEEGGIVVLPMAPGSLGRLKILAVTRGGNETAYGPSAENLHTGDYPLRLPVYLVFRKDAAKRQLLLLRYLLSEDALPVWEKARLVPLPIQARNQQIFDLELL